MNFSGTSNNGYLRPIAQGDHGNPTLASLLALFARFSREDDFRIQKADSSDLFFWGAGTQNNKSLVRQQQHYSFVRFGYLRLSKWRETSGAHQPSFHGQRRQGTSAQTAPKKCCLAHTCTPQMQIQQFALSGFVTDYGTLARIMTKLWETRRFVDNAGPDHVTSVS